MIFLGLSIVWLFQIRLVTRKPNPRLRESYIPMVPSDFPSFKIRTSNITGILTHSKATM